MWAFISSSATPDVAPTIPPVTAIAPCEPASPIIRIWGDGIFRATLFRVSRTMWVLETGSLMKIVCIGSALDDQGPTAPSFSSRRVRPSLSRYMLAELLFTMRFPSARRCVISYAVFCFDKQYHQTTMYYT